jgi:membrane protease YdiL (CAAX protease family)
MAETTRVTRRPWFWAALVALSAAGIAFALRYYAEAFPVLSVDLRMSRAEALEAAETLARTEALGPADFSQAATFGQTDPEVQTYVELEGGGPDEFARLVSDGPYRPYVWQVRHFAEGEATETWFRFTPEGVRYGFRQILPEDSVRPNLDASAARALAEADARATWGSDLAAYRLIESSQETRPAGRVDHTFVYERAGAALGDASVRLRLVVAGDRLGELTHFVHVPEAFLRRYQEMRSANDTLALLSNLIFVIGFLLLAGGIGTFFLMRRGWVLWRPPLVWGFLVSVLMALGSLNQLPLAWIGYDTAMSRSTFLMLQMGTAVVIVVFGTPVLAFVFLAAEGLTRRAFPAQPQQWRLWTRGAANSDAVLGRTAGAYLWTGVDLGFAVLFYLIVSRLPGWWIPSETLVDPNLLATPFPWLMALSISLFAGLWEESLFRAVPIATAKLLGDRFGGTRAWIVAAVVLQALVFAAGHANYPQQPSYARIAELFLPALAWGLFYLWFGLLPTILIHFLHNFTFSSVVFFSADDAGLWVDRTLSVLLMLAPLGVVVVARARWGRVRELPAELRNAGWTPATRAVVAETPEVVNVPAAPEAPASDAATTAHPSSSTVEASAPPAVAAVPLRRLAVAAALGVLTWAVLSDPRSDAPTLEVGREQAIRAARAELERRGVATEDWDAVALVDGEPDAPAPFVWETSGPDVYRGLLGSYLSPPQWIVRFVHFSGPVEERAEEWGVAVGPDGAVADVGHDLPEERPGASLEEAEARAIAEAALRGPRDLNAGDVREISAEARQRPARRDWVFTYRAEGGTEMSQGERRIEIEVAGDEVVSRSRSVHVPESWEREERRRATRSLIVSLGAVGIGVMLLLAGAVTAVVVWSRGPFAVAPAAAVALAVVVLEAIGAVNGIPGLTATLSTAEPVRAQLFARVVGLVVAGFVVGGGLGLLAGLAHAWLVRRTLGGAPLAGLATGAVLAGGIAAASRWGDAGSGPDWPNYAPANGYLPALQPVVSAGMALVAGTTVLLLLMVVVDRVTRGWTRRRTDAAVSLLWLGMVISGVTFEVHASLGADLLRWLANGLTAGVGLLLAYAIYRRYGPGVVPLLVAFLLVADAWEGALARAIPSSVAGALLASVVTLGAAFLWARWLAAYGAGAATSPSSPVRGAASPAS